MQDTKTGTPAPTPGEPTTTLPEDRKRMAHEEQAQGGVQISSSGAVMGQPDAEHGAYGMRRDDAPGAETATEREIRGVAPGKPAARP
ncbi:hypothetical protein [Pseudorhodoferax sp. Leaf267]|uniref:hypothetical protein n=1 Tax=Pseudorhodoferax sp. Leaf267 TaxID=1736316 RepID=UPI00070107A2|nr:hypothetical protein [Pseudorhodoferax sp. Leaf267]KQP22743.1 hypothetical protein ASF43_02245 [Pseudorhodoferax sp. Leaf267]